MQRGRASSLGGLELAPFHPLKQHDGYDKYHENENCHGARDWPVTVLKELIRQHAPDHQLIGAAEQIGYLRRFSLPFNVNSLALACLEEALADQTFVSNHVAQVKQGRERLSQLFDELGLRFCPSQTNFVLVRVGAKVKTFVESMQRRGILVRDSSANPGCDGCVRITIGTPSQMDEVLRAIREAIAEIRR